MRIGGLLGAFGAAVLLVGCDGGCPVKYEICDNDGKDGSNCFLSARFKDLTSCEDHRKMGAMLCNSSTPGRVVCTEDTTRHSLALSRCTR